VLGVLVAAVPRWDAPQREIAERVAREVRLLNRLAGMDLELRVSEWASAQRVDDRTVLVRETVYGYPMPMQVEQQAAFDPIRVTASVAASVHDIDPAPLRDVLGVHETRRAHAVTCLEEVEEAAGEPETDAALRWMRDHLPGDGPAVVVHGDLLGQNIILPMHGESEWGLIDWEFACLGDPAYDLAIVTRGSRRPFGRGRGREQLVEAYAEAGGAPVTEADIAFYELRLIAGWYLKASRGRESGHPPEFYLQRMASFLRRAPGG